MTKVIIKICVGTTCYVMGGSDLLLLPENLSEEQKNLVEIRGIPCLDHCFRQEIGKPPYALINDAIIAEATIEKIILKIEETIKHSL